MKTIQIFGMRCSGTNYLEQLIRANLQDILIVDSMGHKHLWNANINNPYRKPNCIIVIVRNPFDWLRSVHREPHHCPQLIGKDFQTFLTQKWKAYYGKNWNDPLTSKRMSIVLPQNLREEFDHVMDMRNQKLAIYKELCEKNPQTTFLRLKDVQENPEKTIKYICKLFDLKRESNDLIEIANFKKTNEIFKPLGLVKLSNHLLQQIHHSIHWEQEAFFGFSKDSYNYNQRIQWYRYKFLLRQSLAYLRDKISI